MPAFAGIGIALSAIADIASTPLDARIERCLQNVDDQVERDEKHRQHQNRALQQWQIALENRGVEQKTGAASEEAGVFFAG